MITINIPEDTTMDDTTILDAGNQHATAPDPQEAS